MNAERDKAQIFSPNVHPCAVHTICCLSRRIYAVSSPLAALLPNGHAEKRPGVDVLQRLSV